LLRFLHIAAIYKSSPFFGVLPGDLGGYDRWASTIVEQGWLGAWTALLLVLLGNKIFNMGQWEKLAASFVILVLGFMLVHQQIIKPFDFSHSYTDEGVAYEIKDDEQGALAAYVQALEIEPKYLRALDRLGKLQMQRKDYNEARTTYSKILEIAPDSAEAKYQFMWLEKKGL